MRIAVLDDYQGRAKGMADWDSLRAQVEFFHKPIPQEHLPMALESYDVLVLMRERTVFTAGTLRQLPRLRFVVTTGMRNASLDVAHLTDHGVLVAGTGTPSAPSDAGISSTAEVAWALIFALVKRTAWEDRALRDGRWQTDFPTNLSGQTLGLLGLGRLGQQMLGPARAFGMTPIAWSANLTPEAAAEHGVRYVSRKELLAASDVLSVHLVLSDRTRGLIGAEELNQMKPSAYLVNTSRGPIVETSALIDALAHGRIAGAGLDVFDTEPLSPDDPIFDAPHTVLSPHLGYVSYDGLANMYRQVVEDIAAYQAGDPIRLIK